MNTITELENALKAINQAGFEVLIYHLLHLQGNKFIGAPGSVVGKEKTSKGTPDSFFINNDKYIFVECTTKEKLKKSKSFFKKLTEDINHCFDEKETTISKEKIEKIVLACTDKISPEEDRQFREKIKSYNPETTLEILNIQNLPLMIYDLPKLADEYLNVEIIKGDIFSLEDFLIKTTKGLQPSLVNEFIGREEEVKKCIEVFKSTDILLLSGGAGVGKSKLAVKILEELSKENFTSIVIQSSAVPLWDDFKHLFQIGKNYIVLFDDANKSIQNLNYLLSIIEKPKSYSVKVIITSRDYVKKQVSKSLTDFSYEEISLSEFKDEEIEKIILKALPHLKHHVDIKRKIVELAKGNARVALMATYSVTPDAETNYLSSPVLLYEKYFKKIADEIGVFDNPIILKSLAIVCFFGVLDKNNEDIKNTLAYNFNIDWNELWSSIMELHTYEILDVYSNEVVKVSDQVLATYAFYKCFIDEKSSVINYSDWIKSFIQKYSHRITTTLVDANNTFIYEHVKNLVSPHLNEVLKSISSDEQLYSFYTVFWFYKGRECLSYLKEWVKILPQEQSIELPKFTFTHNDHTKATKYFELLNDFWNHSNELLKPSIEITLKLLLKETNRLPEILKFIHEDFKYRWTDLIGSYFRQNILLDVLLDENLSDHEKIFANGIFLDVANVLLGWHFTEFGSAKGRAIKIYNFDLYKSDALMKLRNRILNGVYKLFGSNDEQIQKILQKIIHPDGDIDRTIYVDELPIYEMIISEKLDNTQYSHCEFVRKLAKHLTKIEASYPCNWDAFIHSDIMKLSKFLTPTWEYRDDKSIDEFEQEKREEIDKYIKEHDWNDIEKLLLNIDNLHKQKDNNFIWHIESAVADVYLSIAKKERSEFENALRLFFACKVSFSLRLNVLNYPLQNNILSGEEILNIINEYEFDTKKYWISILLSLLPDDQVNLFFMDLLNRTFTELEGGIYIHRMRDFLKYGKVFENYKKGVIELEDHNIITFITSVILSKTKKQRYDFGLDFCIECAPYFSNHLQLFKAVYLAQKEVDQHFDYDGKEFEAVLKIDSNFFIEYLEEKALKSEYPSFKLDSFKLEYIWTLPDYEEIIVKAMEILIIKFPYFSNWNHKSTALFTFRQDKDEAREKALLLLESYLNKNAQDKHRALLVMNIVLHRFDKHFIIFLKKFLLLNKNIEVFKSIYFDKGGSYSGSRVPRIQNEIDLYTEVIDLIKILPDTLSYSKHIDYLEQQIVWHKKDIEREQRREFEDEYY
ncbi:MAG TPA: hypothetical protein PK431_09595 [Chitinophagales bacterium]|nr:hypothetical protein [Chitinophagales bacterium]